MERWLDSKGNYWIWGFLFLALCVITYGFSVLYQSPHPLRTTLVVAAGILVATLMIGVLFAAIFSPLLVLISRWSGRRKDTQHEK